MGRAAPNATLDALLDYIAESTILTLCNAEPTTYNQATQDSPTGYKLADVTIDSGDFTKADGGVSGRKITIAAQSTVTVDVTGTATHVALCKVSDTTLRFVTTMTSLSLTAAGTVYIAEWYIEVRDPAAP